MAFGSNSISEKELVALDKIVQQVVFQFKETIGIVDFWDNSYEVKRLKGELSDILLESNIDAFIDESDHIVTEVTSLAKVRHRDLLK